MLIAKVLIEHPISSLDTPFDYFIPLGVSAKVGTRVQINFNGQDIVGYVTGIKDETRSKEEIEKEQGFEIKPVLGVLDEEPILNNELRDLATWLAKTTVSPLIACYQTMLPPSLKPNSAKHIKIKTKKYVRVIDPNPSGLTVKQSECLASLNPNEVYLKSSLEYGASIIKKLCETGHLEEFDKESYRNPLDEVYFSSQEPTLNAEQKAALDLIENGKTEVPYLLQGVTGSGKTEVYIRLAAKYLEKGKNVLILVPEISLTPQMVQRFRSRLSYPLAIFHSGISQGERYDEYRRIARHEVNLVIGARSAVFAPLDNIGLIVIDEEHSESYKQDNTPCYHARNVALKRAETHHAKLVLGSATPSLESKARALKGVYQLVELKHRVNNYPLATANIVDLGAEIRQGQKGLLSRPLKKAMLETLTRKEQIVLLLNKRGYAPSVMCPKCRTVFKCPECDVPLKYHKDTNTLNCHYCNYVTKYPSVCPKCGYQHLRNIGYGTQRIEEVIQGEFPVAKVVRMDLDSVKMQKGYERILNGIEDHEYDILLGTQLVAKGLDFPNITLVGVLNADVGLFNGNFRANEEVFQLLTQVLGRAGRGEKKGAAYIQTFNPDHFVIKLAAKQDYETFFKTEMNYRHQQKYPPYRYFALIMLTGRSLDEIEKTALLIKDYIGKEDPVEARVLGPTLPYIAKYQKKNRMRLIYWFKNRENALRILNEVKKLYSDSSKVRLTFDVDPYSDV